jgi:hypothetical protein
MAQRSASGYRAATVLSSSPYGSARNVSLSESRHVYRMRLFNHFKLGGCVGESDT